MAAEVRAIGVDGIEAVAFFDEEQQQWCFRILDGKEGVAGVLFTFHVGDASAVDLNITAKHDDIWRALSAHPMLDGLTVRCVLRTRGCFVWREQQVLDAFADEPRMD